jgi:hypothetical protein
MVNISKKQLICLLARFRIEDFPKDSPILKNYSKIELIKLYEESAKEFIEGKGVQ